MKSKLMLLAVMAVSLTVFSCHKKDDASPGLSAKIIGTWDEQIMYTYWYKNDKPYKMDTIINEAGDSSRFVFKSDHTVNYFSNSDGTEDHETGAYRFNGNNLSLYGVDPADESSDTTIVQCQINGSQMVWSQEMTITSTNGETDKMGFKIYLNKE